MPDEKPRPNFSNVQSGGSSTAPTAYLKTNKSVIVRINDRGPKQAGRILDLSRHAADSLGIRHGRHGGLVEVKLEVVQAAEK